MRCVQKCIKGVSSAPAGEDLTFHLGLDITGSETDKIDFGTPVMEVVKDLKKNGGLSENSWITSGIRQQEYESYYADNGSLLFIGIFLGSLFLMGTAMIIYYKQISFRRWHIGVVFQKYNLIPAMNVFENIVLPAKLLERTVNEKEVFHLAKTLGIEEKLFQMPDELSGGQQQRAAIARAVYTHPTILLGDELTGNLDSRTSASVMELLKKISRQYQQTMLVVTHDEKIAAMADRIIRMKDGRVVEDERL